MKQGNLQEIPSDKLFKALEAIQQRMRTKLIDLLDKLDFSYSIIHELEKRYDVIHSPKDIEKV